MKKKAKTKTTQKPVSPSVTVSVPTSLGDAIAERQESDLNGGYWWALQLPWADARFAGTKSEATRELKRLVREGDTLEESDETAA